ncbi:triosephosphate isomerase [Plasmodium brasilianum]|uniref:Triosephosphate isomerase n=2 Tax=Plasmodium (Plasmodium) TaxID=418103 RepID=A0A1D3PBG1_PLAMA|nr:triosephosphate isomerase, putative [Plasmodium malariae]KAI4838904.1 triosephosphate isomerase [Plasmodium brasilianum]SCN12248.1 triosephosphate isomerase, putative [Plasmodium malariae]
MAKILALLCVYLLNLKFIKFNYSSRKDLPVTLDIRKKFFFFISSRLLLKKRKYTTQNAYNKLNNINLKNNFHKQLSKIYVSYINNNINSEREKKKNKKKIIIGNWKCYLLKEQAYRLIDILTKIKYSNRIDLILSLNLLFIPYLLEKIKENNSKIYTCSQDVSLVNGLGAYTGETTATLIHEFGSRYTIIGHSERKRGFGNNGETLEQTVLKVYNAINSKLKVILCVGEDYINEKFGFHSVQIKKLLSFIKKKISKDEMKNIIIALEPSCAVGTGNPVSSDVINNCYWDIKKNIAEEVNAQISEEMQIVYGGSITKYNMKNFLDNTFVDGFLIGRSSLDESFIDIIKYVDESYLRNT